jgi:hypothetical protein
MKRGISRAARMMFFGLAAVIAAGAVGAQARDDDHRGHWRDRHWGGHPDVYYSAPPVVYPPSGYYAQPGISLNLNFPIR